MKIPTHTSATQWASATGKERKVPKPASEETSSSKRRSTQHSSSTQHRITHWFSTIGIEPSALDYSTQPARQLAQYQRLREQKRLANLQKIMAVALSVSSDAQSSEQVDPDWFHSFISMAENYFQPWK